METLREAKGENTEYVYLLWVGGWVGCLWRSVEVEGWGISFTSGLASYVRGLHKNLRSEEVSSILEPSLKRFKKWFQRGE